MKPPADKDARLPAELEEELDRTVNPGLAAALKKSYAGLRRYAPEDETPDAEGDAGAPGGNDGGKALDTTADDNGNNSGNDGKASDTAGDGGDKTLDTAGNGSDDGCKALDTTADGDGNDSGNGNDTDDGNNGGNDNSDGACDDDGDEADEDEEDNEEEDDEDENGNKPMTLRDHLVELRSRLFKSFLWLLVGFCLSWPWNEELFALLLAPLAAVMPEGVKFVYLSPPEAFFVYMKVCLTAGFFLTSPMVFYQIWAFIAPGLYKEEKLFVLPAALSSAVFFLCGVLFCRFVVFDAAFRFFMSYNKGPVQAMLSMEETFGFALRFLLAFGVIFELPLFIFFLSRLGLVTADMLRRFRRYAVLAAVIVGAILTPPDVISQLLMAGPLILLYEIGIVIALLFGKKKEKDADDAEPDEDDDADETAAADDGAGTANADAGADKTPGARDTAVADDETANGRADDAEHGETVDTDKTADAPDTAVADDGTGTANADAGVSAGTRPAD